MTNLWSSEIWHRVAWKTATNVAVKPASYIRLIQSSTLKKEAECSSETLVPIYQPAWYHITDIHHLSSYCHNNITINTYYTLHFITYTHSLSYYLPVLFQLPNLYSGQWGKIRNTNELIRILEVTENLFEQAAFIWTD